MELEEAIRHCLTMAAEHEGHKECCEEHLQLAEWLIELKVRRAIQMSPMYSIQPPMGTPPSTPIQPYKSIAVYD